MNSAHVPDQANPRPRRPVVLVTGASSGIGLATAAAFAHAGWECLAGVRSVAGMAAIDTLPRKSPSQSVLGVRLDVTRAEDREEVVQTIEKRGLGIDAVVHVAGVTTPGAFEYGSEALDRATLETNLLGPMALTRLLLPQLRATTRPRQPTKVIVVASAAGIAGLPWQASYHASKFGLIGLVDALDHETRPTGVRVVAVLPGTVATPMLRKADHDLSLALGRLPSDAPASYRRGLYRFRRSARFAARFATHPDDVARTIVAIASHTNPPTRTLVGLDARFIHAIVAWLPHQFAKAVLGAMVSL